MTLPAQFHFGWKGFFKALMVVLIALIIFFGGRYTVNTTPTERKPIILDIRKTSVSIGLDGSVSLFNFTTNTMTILPDSMSLQVFLLYNNIIKNQVVVPFTKSHGGN